MNIISVFSVILSKLIILPVFGWIKNKKRAGRKIKIPEFNSLFPYMINEFVTSAQQQIWLDQLFQFSEMTPDDFNQVKGISTSTALFWPLCNDISRYEILFKITLQTFVADDLTDKINDSKHANKSEMKIFDSLWGQMARSYDKCIGDRDPISMKDWRPCTVYFYMILDSLFHDYNDIQKKRFRNIARSALEVKRVEMRLLLSGKLLPTFQENLHMRKISGGAMFILQLIEYSDDMYLSENDWNNPSLQQVTDFVGEIIVMDNDLYSFEKEYVDANYNVNDMSLNMVAVVIRQKNCGIEEAVRIIRDKLIDSERMCWNIMHEILNDSFASETTKLYLESVKYLIGGNHFLNMNASRYNYP